MTRAPRCKLCGTDHWLREPHRYETAAVALPAVTKPVTKRRYRPPRLSNSVTPPVGRPRRYATDAERQRAYRERKAGVSGDPKP